jgi:hypothetical protein
MRRFARRHALSLSQLMCAEVYDFLCPWVAPDCERPPATSSDAFSQAAQDSSLIYVKIAALHGVAGMPGDGKIRKNYNPLVFRDRSTKTR